MRLSRRTLTKGLIASGLMATSANATEPMLRMPDMPLHDPWILADKATGIYHLFTSNNPRVTGERITGVMVYKSRDLKDWSTPQIVFRLPKDVWGQDGGWAPEVHVWQGRYYMFVTIHNEAMPLPPTPEGRATYRRSTILAVADKPDGPYEVVRNGEPVAPADLMTLDGTLYVDRKGRPHMVYAHEHIQVTDGTFDVIPLKDDLSAAGPPRLLFPSSIGPWFTDAERAEKGKIFVSDGPQFYRTKKGVLLMIWSTHSPKYLQALARSKSGEIDGPWEQLGIMVARDSGHGMIFETFDDKLMLIMHRPFKNARGRIFELADLGDRIAITRQRIDLDGDPVELSRPGPLKPEA